MHFYLYQPLLLWLVFAAIYEYIKPNSKANKIFFCFSIAALVLMQAFRYNQGPDYWGYRYLYVEGPTHLENLFQFFMLSHGEPGFDTLIFIFRVLGVTSWVFYALLGTVDILIIAYAIYRYSKRINLGTLVLYPTLYLSYVMSGVRQATATAIFLCWGPKLLHEKKYIQYTLLIILCGCFHKYALILLILVPINIIKTRWLMISVPIVGTLSAIYILFSPLREYLATIINESSQLYRFTQINISWYGIAERTVGFAMISFLYWNGKKLSFTSTLYKIYSVSYLLNILLMITDFGSQRLTMPMKMVEIILIPTLIAESSVFIHKLIITLMIIGIETLMTLKNLHYYSQNYSFYNYPYISIVGRNDAFTDEIECLKNEEAYWKNYYDYYPNGIELIKYRFIHMIGDE